MVLKSVVLSVQNHHTSLTQKNVKPVQIKDMFIDIGVRSKEDAENHGIEVGNMITPYSEFEELANGKYLTAKAFDNRYGCALAIDVLKRLKDEQIGVDLYAGATVQEEVGLRGAKLLLIKSNLTSLLQWMLQSHTIHQE